jgi:geranylgeranyl pyrophosphate synthase
MEDIMQKKTDQTINIETYLKSHSARIDQDLEQIIPKKISKEWLEQVYGKSSYAYDADSIQRALADPIWDLLNRGGKRWRPILMLLCNEAVGGNPNSVRKYAGVLELIHNGTLMIDDVEDSSELRREKPCTYKIFGVDIAVNAGNAMYYFPYHILLSDHALPDPMKMKIHELIALEMIRLHAGQGMDILWHRGQKYDVTEGEYLQMCSYKTGILARMATKMGAILGGANEEQVEKLGRFGESIGVAFQIQDDILNLAGEEFAKSKGVGEDIHEGKRTIMVLHTLNKANEKDKKRLLDILNSHPTDEKTIREAISIIEKHGSMDYARKRAKELVEKSWKDVEKVLPESEAKNTLRAFAEFLIHRKV